MTTIESSIINSITNKTKYCNINTSYRIYENLGQLRVNGSLIAVVYYVGGVIREIVITVRKTTPLILVRLAAINNLVGLLK